MRARVCKAAQGLATLVAIATAFTFAARAEDYTVIDSATALALGGASGGDEIRRIDNGNGTFDLVHIFTTTGEVLHLTTPSDTSAIVNARYLAVGGGGSGGSDCGGGGGAGGYVTNSLVLGASTTYDIVVGEGGAGWTNNSTNHHGEDGTASAITNATAGTEIVQALGGGGGATWNSKGGSAGGSGGGSISGTAAAATQPSSTWGGLGNAGGTGNNDNTGGGGGGAGGAGTVGGSAGGTGGAGVVNDITGVETVYAFGGGGRGSSKPGVSGDGVSDDVYGDGGDSSRDGQPGKPNTGAGGGGGGTDPHRKCGAGGSGIVVIRYTVLDILDDGSVLYTFAKTNAVNQLTLPKAALARLLLVGGGGGGAGPRALTGSYGGAGGGGAGGMIDTNNVLLASGTYSIMVGGGGAGGAAGTAPSGLTGSNGEPSLITTDGGSVTNFCALGGGGGGARAVGNAGGSGGGGSLNSSGNTRAGGAATQPESIWGGYGSKGGDGTVAAVGAGGGGAGGAGASPSSGKGGDGGEGRISDITGSDVYYAAGGGGGARTATGGAGGSGIGGDGGTSGPVAATAGRDGTGSGGGGGRQNGAGGAGGSGIVYIRIFRYMPDKPASAEYEFVYDGTEHPFYSLVAPEANGIHWVETDDVDASPYTITLGGESVTRIAVTAVGTYTFTVALKQEYLDQGYAWDDGSTADQVVTVKVNPQALADVALALDGWQIGEEPSVPALTANMTLTGESSEGTHDGDYYFEYSSDGTSWQSFSEWYAGALAGTHYIKAVIRTDSPNFTWSSENDPVESFSLWSYTEGKYPDYLGYHADIAAVDTGTNRLVKVVVSEGVPFGFSYSKTREDGSDIRFTAVTNGVVTLLAYTTATWDVTDESVFWVSVPAGVDGITMNWGVILDAEGNEIEIPDSPDGSEVMGGVVIPDELYADARAYHTCITVTNYGGAALTDFPMAVRLGDGSPAGFTYATAASDGSDLVFSLADGTLLPSEIEQWDPSGASLVWVKVPTYRDGTQIWLHWGKKAELTIPAATEVWSAYAGVWHMGSGTDETAGTYGTAATKDSTGNNADATVGSASSGVSAVFGRGLNSTSNADGPILKIPAGVQIDNLTNAAFTASFWAKIDNNASGKTGWPALFARRSAHDGTGYGVRVVADTINPSVGTNIRIYYGGSGNYGTWNNDTRIAGGTWQRHDVMYKPGRVEWYIDGVFQGATYSGLTAWTDYGYVSIGGWGEGSDSLVGAVDELRMRSGEIDPALIAAEKNQWALIESGTETYTAAATVIYTPGADAIEPTVVTPHARFANRWITEPTFSASELNQGTDPSPYLSRGAAVYGTPTNAYYTVGGEAVADITTAPAGTYTVRVWVEAGTSGTCSWEGLAPFAFDFTLTVDNSYDNLIGDSGTLTQSGRVLLVNDDDGYDPPVADQSYWQTNTTATAYETFWTHADESTVSTFPHLMAGTTHTLQTTNEIAALCGATTLWRMENVRIGNLNVASGTLNPSINYLPYSSSAKAISSAAGATGSQAESAHLVMRNVEGAAIYSPCYTNGIGTLYFDAVNAWTDGAGDYYNLEVQICTNCEDSAGVTYDALPTDENIRTIEMVDETEVTNHYALAHWETVPVLPFKRDVTEFGDGDFHRQDQSETLALTVENGGTMDNFYRVCVKLNYNGPIRFRIRRVANVHPLYDNVDAGGHILLDNIVVSYPAMRVDLAPYYGDATYDASRTGEAALGWAGSFDVPLPGVGDALKGRARTTVSGGAPGQMDRTASDLVSGAQLWYRWRYLAQETVPTEGWRAVSLDPLGGFAATEALTLPEGRRGDVEFYFTARLSAPYYDYVDYSGLGLGLGELYTENIASVTNSFGAAANLPSLGEDWFVRLREGVSDCEGVNLVVSNRTSGVVSTNAFALAANRTWQAFYETPAIVADGLAFRIDVVNAQTVGETSWATNASHYVYRTADGATTKVFMTGQTEATNETAFSTPIEVDAATGYLMFQFDEEAKGVSIVHAERQTFNGWDDAAVKSDKRLFTGSSVELTERTGVASEKKEYAQTFAGWGTMPTTNPNWAMPTIWTDINNMYGHRAYERFTSDTNGVWRAGPGMWVARNYHDGTSGSGVGLQMEGCGLGYLQYVASSGYPRGLESISFNARLAQSIGVNDFSYYFGENMLTLSNYVFTAGGSFDRNENKDFRGNASLSLLAHYVPGRGGYEFRIEQYAAKNSGAAANEKSQIVSLYKWNSRSATLLTCQTNTTYAIAANKSNASVYTPLFISVSNATDGVWIFAGRGTGTIGNTASTSGQQYFVIGYKDTSAPCRTGTYGVLTSNCPGDIHNPYVYTQPLPPTQLQTSAITPSATLMWSNKTLTFPGTALSRYSSIKAQADAADCLWYTEPGRMTTYNTGSTMFGFRGTNETQVLKVYTAPAGTTGFGTDPIATVAVDGFGQAGETSKSHHTIPLYTTSDCAVQIAMGGTYLDPRVDVVIDSVEMKQWRGDSWDNLGTDIITIKPVSGDASAASNFGLTNFTFNSAWVGNGWMRLSAKRTEPNTASYVRSPLMDGYNGRGKGLGMFAFTYANAQTNAVLELQVCTNGVAATTISDIVRDDDAWETVERYDFSKMTAAERRDGTLRHYFGLHDVTGIMRLVVPKDAVAAVQDETNTNRFGEVTIKKLLCRDEPKLDSGCWWGWNLRTLGDKDDMEKRMYLPDAGDAGLSLALNNSITADVSDPDTQYSDHLPFVQTPSFSDATRGVGEVSFKARKYLYTEADTNATAAAAFNARDAKVTLFGATRSEAEQSAMDNDDSYWTALTNFTVSATTYARFNYKLPQNERYRAFRLAVDGVEGVESSHAPYDAVRVLIDDVLVSEAVYATLSFRMGTVGAFRSDMTGRSVVPNVPSVAEQPLAEEGWSVQGEVFASQLGDEIDFGEEDPSRRPRVRLYWYRGTEPWGFEKWKSMAEASGDASRAGAAWLDEAEGTNLWFRGSYSSPSGNTVGENDPNTTLQYMLETVYYMLNAKDPVTNALKKAEWENPSWYRGVDLNATLGGGDDDNFSAYTLLDNVAPGWASINEVHLFEEYDDDLNNFGRTNQYVEIRAPYVPLDGWSVRMLEVDPETQTIVTNTIATFGSGGLSATKDSAYVDEGNVFHVIASPHAAKGAGGALTKDDGTLDGTWDFPLPTTTFWNGGEIWALQPIGIQLVRANSVIEHEVVVMGTNLWNQAGISESLRRLHSPTGVVDNLNALMPGSAFFHAGDDSYAVGGNGAYSVGVYTNKGETAEFWNNTMACTPGRRNAGQTLEQPPQAQGTRIAVYCSVAGDHILQTVGEGGATNATQVVYAQKGGDGTNITYTLDRWYALGSVTTNGAALANLPATVGHTAVVNVGAGCSNAVYVTAMAGPSPTLDAYVDANDPYRAAILDWLSKGETLRGPFANDTEELCLAKFRRYHQPTGIVTDESTFETNLNLKVMYWLDMDPTVSNQWLVGGWYKAPEPQLRQGGSLTNLLLHVKMYMTNETEGVEAPAWAPYVLRGREPGVTSHDYLARRLRLWNAATFKPTGIMLNGNTSMYNLENWMPLRLFVFDGSPTGDASFSFNSDFETVIEVIDPHSSQSPSFTGWYDWEQKHGRQFIGFFWSLDERQQPSLGVEKLKETNTYDGL